MASGTLRSSAFIKSTISIGEARSIEAVRGLRRSVSRGSNINALPNGEARPNLPDAARESQDNLERDDETLFCCVLDAVVVCRIARRAAAWTCVFRDGSGNVAERWGRGLHRKRRE